MLKKLKGFDLNYYISSNGSIILDDERLISHIDKKNGHVYSFLRKNGHLRKYYVFKLVADSFLNQPYHYPYISHKDGNKQNNNIDNLEFKKYLK